MYYSFKCGIDYHAPTDCVTIKKWLTKCADDSETANYISANTKDVSRYRGILVVIYYIFPNHINQVNSRKIVYASVVLIRNYK